MFSYKRAKVYLNASDKIIKPENFTQMLIKNITKKQQKPHFNRGVFRYFWSFLRQTVARKTTTY